MPRICPLCVVLASLGAAACTPPPSPPPAPRTTLRVLTGGGPTTLDPHVPFDDVSSAVLGNLFDTLVHFDKDMRLTAGLARRWINPDERTWRFFLDGGARFPDGSALRAEDVKFSIERLLALPRSDLQAFARHVSRVEVIDELTLDIRTERPVAILNYLAFIPVISRRHTEAAPDRVATEPFGTGPYQLESWDPGRALVLRANPHHRPLPQVTRVEFEIRQGPALLEQLRTSRPDVTLFLGQSAIEALTRSVPPSLRLVAADGLYVFYAGLNVRPRLAGAGGPNPLADVRLRRALAAATRREQIVDFAAMGFALPAHQLVVPQVFGFDPELEGVAAADPEAARREVAALGLGSFEPSFLVSQQGSPRVEQLLGQQWAAVGVKTRIETVPGEQVQPRLDSGRFDMNVQGWGCTSGDAGELIDFLLHSRDAAEDYGLGNVYGFEDDELDRISEHHLAVFDPRRRLEMLQRALRIAAEQVPLIPLYAARDVYVLSADVAWEPRVDGEFRIEEVQLTGSGTPAAR